MTKDEVEEALNSIKDLPFSYGNKLWKLKSFNIDEEKDRVEMFTHQGNRYDKGFDAIDEFIKQLKTVEPIKKESMPPQKKEGTISEIIIAMKDILIDDIERIKNDAKYIPQAKARNNNVNSLINLARLQLALTRV